MKRVAITVVVIACFAIQSKSDESIQFGVSVVINDQEVVSTAGATYTAPNLCLDCRHWGNHRINGASASNSWSLAATQDYQRQLTDWISGTGCYTGFIEGWGAGGFYGNKSSDQKCAPCVLWTEASGSGSVSGAPYGKSTHECHTHISLSATPAEGWKFVQWSGSISTTSPDVSFSLDASKTMTAFFEQLPALPKEDTDLPECPTSPIIIDLDDDGFRLTGIEKPGSLRYRRQRQQRLDFLDVREC